MRQWNLAHPRTPYLFGQGRMEATRESAETDSIDPFYHFERRA